MRSRTDPFDADSVAAIIVTHDARYLMQRRDDSPGVDFPGMWGLFGGSAELGEEAEQAMRRELQEELSFSPESLLEIATLVYDERATGGWYCRRRFFEVVIDDEDVARFVLAEGAEMALFAVPGIAAIGNDAIPYDLCAILMHDRRVSSREALRARNFGTIK
jgi:8-oxo-dGTP pyrophosphatase MutT (NUDIX family)